MRARSASVILALALTTACAATTPAPPEWAPTPHEAQKRVLGHWVIVEVFTGRKYSGELIAVGRIDEPGTKIYVGTEREILAIPIVWVSKIRVVEHRRSGNGPIIWSWVGTVSTISHGFFLVFSAPTWLLSGTISAVRNANLGVGSYRVHQAGAAKVRKFARFPQGLPRGLRAKIREVPRK